MPNIGARVGLPASFAFPNSSSVSFNGRDYFVRPKNLRERREVKDKLREAGYQLKYYPAEGLIATNFNPDMNYAKVIILRLDRLANITQLSGQEEALFSDRQGLTPLEGNRLEAMLSSFSQGDIGNQTQEECLALAKTVERL
ncbi:MAG: hypothetical protein ABIH50_00285 [bacterium]